VHVLPGAPPPVLASLLGCSAGWRLDAAQWERWRPAGKHAIPGMAAARSSQRGRACSQAAACERGRQCRRGWVADTARQSPCCLCWWRRCRRQCRSR
jgi:hypothetical protein